MYRSWPLLAEDPLWRPQFPVIRPLEGQIQELREENERLKQELGRQRVSLVRTILAWESERSERSRTEAALYSTYHDFWEWFNTAAFPMTCIGKDGIIDQANNQQLEVLGYARGEYLGHSLEEFFSDAEVLQALSEAMFGGALLKNRATTVRCKSGVLKPVMITCELFDQGGDHGICCYIQDLSEILHAKSDQKKSEQQFRQLAENIQEVFWMSTLDKKEMLYVSPAYEAVWGRDCKSLYERPESFLEGIHEDDRERVLKSLPHQCEGGYREEYRVVRPDGSIRWVCDRAFQVRDETGEVYRLAGLAEDITEIKEAGEQLRDRAFRQRTLAEIGHIALRQVSLQEIFDETVTRLAETLGVEYSEILQLKPGNGHFLLRAGVGWREGVVGKTTFLGGERTQAGFTAFTREPVILEDSGREERFSISPLLREHGVVSGMSVVVEGRPQPYGVLGVYTRRSRHFNKYDLDFLQAAAHILATVIERRVAEEVQEDLSVQLSAEKQRLSEILRDVPGIVWELKLDRESGRLLPVYINDYAEVMLPGFSRDEWFKNVDHFDDRIHPDESEYVRRRITSVLAGGESGTEQFRWIGLNGRTIWLESYKSLIRDDRGDPAGLRGVIIDITERKRVEEQFEDLLRHLPAVVWESRVDPVNQNAIPVFVSDYVETLLGFPKEEWKAPEFWLNQVHPEDREGVVQRMEEIFSHQEIGGEEFRWIARDGRTVWVEASKRVVRDESGRVIGIRGVTIDITERKRAEKERKTAEERFHAFMDNSPLAAVIKDNEGRYVYGNKVFNRWCEGLGFVCGQSSDFDLFPLEAARRHREQDREVLEKDIITQVTEVLYNGDGKKHFWSVLRFPVPDATGERLLGTVAIDVTERRSLEREILAISDREQRRLGQELHDGLCQHLLGLALMSKTLADRMNKKKLPQAKEVQTISDFLYEGLGLARGLMKGLHLVHIQGVGGLKSALEEFSHTTTKLFGKTCIFRSDVEFEVRDKDVGTHLFRIAQEATHNAIKHGQPTEVEISLSRVGDDLLLKVENDGEPFPEAKPEEQGMGIRTMRYRADLIGAGLYFEQRPGGGSIVGCRIPAGPSLTFV